MNAARRPNGPLVKCLCTRSLFSLVLGEGVRSCPLVGKPVAEPDSTLGGREANVTFPRPGRLHFRVCYLVPPTAAFAPRSCRNR